MSETPSITVQEKTINLFQYVREFIASRSKVIRTIDSYEEYIGFYEIPKINGCGVVTSSSSMESQNTDEYWIDLRKPKRVDPPVTPDELTLWVDQTTLKKSSSEPKLLESIIINSENELETKTLFLKDNSHIKNLFEQYVSDKWKKWADADKIEAHLEDIYKKLFSIYQQYSKFGEGYELVVGFALLKYLSAGHEIKRHLLTVPAAISFDKKTGRITVGATVDGIKLNLEQDMIEIGERPLNQDIKGIEEMITEVAENIWDNVSVHQIARSYMNALASGNGIYLETEDPREQVISDRPQATYSPYLILRKNSEKNLLKVYSELIEKVTESDVPKGMQSLVGIISESSHTFESEYRNISLSQADGEVYFPLVSNNEQKEIAERIERQQAVVVQGPPGTGKSHTIANLICHLLAQGKRILITSHTTRALAVLKKKIPKEVSALCVELLGSDQSSMKSLESSVTGLLYKYHSWNSIKSEQTIKEIRENLKRSKSKKSEILLDLRRLREKDTYIYNNVFGFYNGTLESISKKISEETSKYSWFKDSVPEEIEVDINKLIKFLHLYRETRDYDQELKNAHLDADVISQLEQVNQLFIKEQNIKSSMYSRELTLLSELRIDQMSVEEIQNIMSIVEPARSLLRPLSSSIKDWHTSVFTDFLNGSNRKWKIRLTESKEILSKIERNVSELPRRITGLETTNLRVLKNCIDNYRSHIYSGKSDGFLFFKNSVVKEAHRLLDSVYVDGVRCLSQVEMTIDSLKKYVDTELLIEDFSWLWQDKVNLTDHAQSLRIDTIKITIQELESISYLHERYLNIKNLLASVPPIKNLCQLQQLFEDLFLIENKVLLRDIESQIQSISESLNNLIGLNRELALVRDNLVGLKSGVDSRDSTVISQKLHQLKIFSNQFNKLKELSDLKCDLDKYVPIFIQDYSESFNDDVWEARLREVSKAVAFRKTEEWISKENANYNNKELERELNEVNNRILRLNSELSAELAWSKCLSNRERFGEEQRQALIAWKQAVERIGRGTGRHANKHRQDAKRHMESCRPAIPAWIMPINKVAEVTVARPEQYDVVIIDEASQSGPEAIFLQYIAKQIVIVGDDKQIRPDNVGIDRDGLHSVHQKFLTGIPHSDIFGPESSFFNIAEVRYGNGIRLREHFRCMPEIIQFSNNLCYSDNPLIPLKQYSLNRLSPTVNAIYIKDGSVRETKNINDREAEAIVDKICEVVSDSKYKGKTIGVISLLGEWHAKYIQNLLLDKIGAEEIEKREIVCGDAYAFQGDERDIIFLSMVSAVTEGRRIGSLTKKQDERRFNVAASRAKEQMFLYHSVTLNDLNPNCMRYKLLEYCLNPKLEQTTVDGITIKSIKNLSSNTNRSTAFPPEPFDSWFEVDVFLEIHSKGFRVIPQYEVNGRRIDLVVEGLSGRLAVECDGDRWHGPEQYDRDMARQRDLERCGWTFFRIRGSEFYSNKDKEKVLSSLWKTLEDLEIFPNSMDIDTIREDSKVGTVNTNSDSEALNQPADEIEDKVELEEEPAQTKIETSHVEPVDYSWVTQITANTLAEQLTAAGFEVVDKRDTQGGCLWVVENENTQEVVSLLKMSGYNFVYTGNGSRSTNHRPAWYLKENNSRRTRSRISTENAVSILSQRNRYQFYLNGERVIVRQVDFRGLANEWKVEIRSGPAAIITINPLELEYMSVQDQGDEE